MYFLIMLLLYTFIANNHNMKKIPLYIIYLLINVVLAKLLLRALGESPNYTAVMVMTIACCFICSSRKTFLFIFLPFSVLTAIYAPIGFEYGLPTYQYVASLFATDVRESIEFLNLISTKYYFEAIAMPIISILSYKISSMADINPCRNKTVIMCSVVLLIICAEPTKFFHDLFESCSLASKELADIRKFANKSEWGKSSAADSKYDDYVLIIGESARKDYFHIYGYPVKNTPYLDKVNGTIVDGFTSGGTFTIGSLRLMLTQGDKVKWEPNYNLNIVDLAKSAGFETYWISNQGQFGKYDTPISSIAKRADYSYFFKGTTFAEKNTSDFDLIPILERKLAEKSNKKRLFILHTMGSHPWACDRISDMSKIYKVDLKEKSYIACYVTSIEKTDLFIKKVHQVLLNNDIKSKRNFSLVYFSDHGMVHREIDGVIQLNNNYVSKYHYNIPLLRISSDDTERRVVKGNKSGLMFVGGLANWMGITNKKLETYNLFNGVSEREDFGLDKRLSKSYKVDDPAIDISGNLL